MTKRPDTMRSRAVYFRFRHGRTACTRRRVRLHRASIAVSKPTPRYYIPGVGLPLHSSTSTLGMTPRDPHAPLRTQGLNHGRAAVAEAGVLRRRFTVSARRCSEEPFTMNSLIPSARTCRSVSGVLSPVKMITGCLRSTLRICFKTVTPSSSGRFRSRRMTSGCSWRYSRRPFQPLSASTTSYPC